jgi:hypothetical protein
MVQRIGFTQEAEPKVDHRNLEEDEIRRRERPRGRLKPNLKERCDSWSKASKPSLLSMAADLGR